MAATYAVVSFRAESGNLNGRPFYHLSFRPIRPNFPPKVEQRKRLKQSMIFAPLLLTANLEGWLTIARQIICSTNWCSTNQSSAEPLFIESGPSSFWN